MRDWIAFAMLGSWTAFWVAAFFYAITDGFSDR